MRGFSTEPGEDRVELSVAEYQRVSAAQQHVLNLPMRSDVPDTCIDSVAGDGRVGVGHHALAGTVPAVGAARRYHARVSWAESPHRR